MEGDYKPIYDDFQHFIYKNSFVFFKDLTLPTVEPTEHNQVSRQTKS